MDCHGTCPTCQAEKAAWERVNIAPRDEYQRRLFRREPTQTGADAARARAARRAKGKAARRARKAQRRRSR
jgi:hypothetical protein